MSGFNGRPKSAEHQLENNMAGAHSATERDALVAQDIVTALTGVGVLILADIAGRMPYAVGLPAPVADAVVWATIFGAIWGASIVMSLRTDKAVHVDLGGEA